MHRHTERVIVNDRSVSLQSPSLDNRIKNWPADDDKGVCVLCVCRCVSGVLRHWCVCYACWGADAVQNEWTVFFWFGLQLILTYIDTDKHTLREVKIRPNGIMMGFGFTALLGDAAPDTWSFIDANIIRINGFYLDSFRYSNIFDWNFFVCSFRCVINVRFAGMGKNVGKFR